MTDPNDCVQLLMVCNEFFLEDLRKLCEISIRVSLEEDYQQEISEEMCDTALNAFQGCQRWSSR